MDSRTTDKMIPGLEIAIATMGLGERCEAVVAPYYAFGHIGNDGRVGPYMPVTLDIELVHIGHQVPKFPTLAERDAAERKRADEERAAMEANPPPSVGMCWSCTCHDCASHAIWAEERVSQAQAHKEAGNKHVSTGDWEKAKGEYDLVRVWLSYRYATHCLTGHGIYIYS